MSHLLVSLAKDFQGTIDIDPDNTIPRSSQTLKINGQVGAALVGIDNPIYIDDVGGDDNNAGDSPANALKTLEGFYQKYALLVYNGYRFIVNFAGGAGGTQQNYTIGLFHIGYGGDAQLPAIRYRGPEMVLAALTTGPNSLSPDGPLPANACQAVNLTADGVPTPLRTRLFFTAAAPAWTVNDMAGRYFLRISNGGQRKFFEIPISGNGADFIDVDTGGLLASSMVGVVDPTDLIEIVKPGANFLASAATGTPNGSPGIRITGDNVHVETVASDLVGAIFERLAFSSALFSRSNSRSSFDRCSQTGGNFTCQGGSASFVNCAVRHNNAINQNLHFITWDGSARTLLSRPDVGLNAPTDKVPSVCLALFNTYMNVGARFSPESNQQDGLELHGQGQANFGMAVTIKNPPNLAGVTGAIMVQGQKAMLFMGRAGTNPAYRPAPLIVEGLAAGKVGLHCRLGGVARLNPTVTSIDQAANLRCSNTGTATVNLGTGVGEFNEALGFNGDFSRLAPAAPYNFDTARIFKTY